jgi:hypothetical protein
MCSPENKNPMKVLALLDPFTLYSYHQWLLCDKCILKYSVCLHAPGAPLFKPHALKYKLQGMILAETF